MCTPRSVSCIVPAASNAVGLGVPTLDRQSFDDRHPLPIQTSGLTLGRIGRAGVGADEADGGPAPAMTSRALRRRLMT